MPRFRSWIFIMAGTAAVVVLALGATWLIRRGAAIKETALIKHTELANRTAQAQPPGENLSVFDQQARQAGIVACAQTFSALGRGMSANFLFATQSQWSAKDANEHSIQSLVALKPHEGTGVQQPDAGIVFAVPVGGKCEGHLVRVTPVEVACTEVAARLSKAGGEVRPFGELALAAVADSGQVMLIPFNNSCVTVTVLRGAG